uniref:F5/8 type C domain-containing protein n=1 Tax=Pyrodinium bahamense TaxID=73915 RepID=A0A7S0ABQ2_9DINO|mmetsp:Transcript_30593/g.84374  ORF Transcript_30593/g.84374 Transcript_30593/m.84374 type:complete len:155 (+) Transcript_30593:170-634(+)
MHRWQCRMLLVDAPPRRHCGFWPGQEQGLRELPGTGGHSAQSAVDGSRLSYWASAFDPPKDTPVVLELRMEETKPVSVVKIDWEYPAKSFEVQVGTGGKWSTFYTTVNNVLLENNLFGNAKVGDSLRILMKEPHPIWGSVDGHMLYGIRGVTIS